MTTSANEFTSVIYMQVNINYIYIYIYIYYIYLWQGIEFLKAV